MTKDEKKYLIEALLEEAKKGLINKVDKMPEEWAGVEIRQFIADYLEANYVIRMEGKRKNDYRNDVMVLGLF